MCHVLFLLNAGCSRDSALCPIEQFQPSGQDFRKTESALDLPDFNSPEWAEVLASLLKRINDHYATSRPKLGRVAVLAPGCSEPVMVDLEGARKGDVKLPLVHIDNRFFRIVPLDETIVQIQAQLEGDEALFAALVRKRFQEAGLTVLS